MMSLKKISIITCFLFIASHVFAVTVPTKLHSVTGYIKNIDKAITDVKSNSKLPVVFPGEIPESKNTLYAGSTSVEDFWVIYVDTTNTCNGVKVCNVGLITAHKNANIDDTYMNMKTKKQQKKSPVLLADGTNALFTPGHAEADWHNPTLEWKNNDITYMLTWSIKGKDEKIVLTTMANSAMHPGSN